VRIALNVLLIIVSLGMIASVLFQSSKSAGLSGVFGGAQTFFSKKKSLDDFLAKLTVVLAVLFVVLAIGLTSLQS